MVTIEFSPSFKKLFSKIKDKSLKERILKQIVKIAHNPDFGKPMRYARKGTREIYVSPYRLSYIYDEDKGAIILLDLYHKDDQ
jgi:mRNA-degrading endonuclease RelE of RelBE toxin-antitoxin system